MTAKAIKRVPARRPTKAARPSASLSGQAMRLLEAIGISSDLLRRLRNWGLALLLAAGIVIGIGAMGVPRMVGMGLAHGIGRLGFVVRNIQIAGRNRVDRDLVYGIALESRGQDMPLVDLAAIRQRLLQLGWVGDARVSRRLPDTLLIDIVERQPAAILQRNQMLSLVDAEGHVLAPVDPRTMPVQLPLVIGNGVEGHIAELRALIGGQPALRQLVAGGTWVGGRRWDLRFQSGEVLALPEGADLAQKALARFVRKDSEARLLGQGYVRIDMRDPKQIVVRTSSEPGSRIGDTPPAAVT